ncbi:MAG: leucine-rich repeat domain-containing protein, partial [Clostridia bacterium]|nr:leucine-rich repeat domain-containing protein [Clostridia bacterium]
CGGHEYITFESTTYGMVAVKKKDIDTEDLTELIVPTHTEDGIRVNGIEKLNFSNLKKVTIPDGIKYIFDDAFSNCNYLEEVVFLSESTTAVEIHGGAFYGCIRLKKITFPENCVFVEPNHTFSLNKSLKTIDIPDGIETLGESMFWGCISLEKVTIPDSVKTVDRYVFEDCYSLKEVDLGNGITELSYEMFKGCSALETIVIPDSVTKISDKVFYGCDNLKTVVLPKSLTDLSSMAFYACVSLKEIKFEGTIEEWKSKNFYVDSGIERIICFDGVIEV